MAARTSHEKQQPPQSGSQTAQDYINAQLTLEHEARQALPYTFDCCTKPMGPLRQLIFACLTCTPPDTEPAGICYSCSISCHGSHGDLVELFAKRNFVCDCGTNRFSGSLCTLQRIRDEQGTYANQYNQNFRGRFCENELYEVDKETGTMYQCMLGDVCGEDWYHDSCIIGMRRKVIEKSCHAQGARTKSRDASSPESEGGQKESVSISHDQPQQKPQDAALELTDVFHSDEEEEARPEGFPAEDDFEYFICWRCVSANPWLRLYAGSPGFLDAVPKADSNTLPIGTAHSLTSGKAAKRKYAEDQVLLDAPRVLKRVRTPRVNDEENNDDSICRLPSGLDMNCDKEISLFLKIDFRSTICHCAICYPLVSKFPVLLEEEETYEPPLDEDNDGGSTAHESLLDAGERALSTVDRVKAIEGVMAYNILKEKVRTFLKPFADEKRLVGAEDVKKYFQELQGDGHDAVRSRDEGSTNQATDERGEQDGY